LSRRAALWHALAAEEEELPLFAGLADEEPVLPPLSDMPLEQEVSADYATMGLSLKSHPIAFVRPMLSKLGVSTAEELTKKPGQASLKIAGLVLVRQRPSTAKGTIFMTLEDETGTANLIIWPRVWERYRRVAKSAVAIIAQGTVERSGAVVHVCVKQLEDLSERMRSLASQSRDFR
jgi:error-prone DNA polymerase